MERHELPGGCWFSKGRLPPELQVAPSEFEQLWLLHPPERPEILIHGRRVRMPRWQQVFGADYHFTGSTHVALPIPSQFRRWLAWAQREIEPCLNGVVVNWYDGQFGHYIGRHRDSTSNMIPGAPIAMISLGQSRTFRLRPHRGAGKVDSRLGDGAVIVLPYEANLQWTHEVTRSARDRGRRISITLRAFLPARLKSASRAQA